MEKITLTIRDKTKVNFIMELLNQFKFVELPKSSNNKKSKQSFFSSAGLLKNRDISAKKLREDAWKRGS